MKTILFLMITSALVACSGNQEASNNQENTEVKAESLVPEGWMSRGDTINEENAMSIESFKAAISDKESMEAKIETEILSCCKKKGCWMKVDLGEGEEMRVTFKDYGFFVPLDAAGKKVIMQGNAYYDTTSVDMLRHYAEDAGASEEEIAAITEPKRELAFEATGVLLK
mgnify:CR=1 FL=1